MQALRTRTAAIERVLRDEGTDIDLSVIVAPEEEADSLSDSCEIDSP